VSAAGPCYAARGRPRRAPIPEGCPPHSGDARTVVWCAAPALRAPYPHAPPQFPVRRARHGLAPKRNGQLGHFRAVHRRTSSLELPQQSRQCAPSDNARPCARAHKPSLLLCMWPTPLGFQIACVAVRAILADFRVGVRSLPLQGAEIGAEGDATSGPHGFSGCGEFPAFFPTRAMRSRRRARSASLSGARHGLAPKRNGQLGHFRAVHRRTSSLELPQQSRQCARIAAAGAIGICPSPRSSSGSIFRGSRPIRRPSGPASVPSATSASLLVRAPPAFWLRAGPRSFPDPGTSLFSSALAGSSAMAPHALCLLSEV
jgi:hypothetical protein